MHKNHFLTAVILYEYRLTLKQYAQRIYDNIYLQLHIKRIERNIKQIELGGN